MPGELQSNVDLPEAILPHNKWTVGESSDISDLRSFPQIGPVYCANRPPHLRWPIQDQARRICTCINQISPKSNDAAETAQATVRTVFHMVQRGR